METTSSYHWCQLLLFWSCFVDPDHVPLSSGKSKWVTQNRSKYNMALDLRGGFLWLVLIWEVPEKTGLQPPHPVSLSGHCSRTISAIGSVCHACLLWLAHIRMRLPWKMSNWSKWVPLLPFLSFQAELCTLFWWKTRDVSLCVRAVDARAHRCMASEILNREEGEHFFKVTEKVGRFIVQPCVLVHTWAYTHMVLLQVCAGKHAPLFQNSLLM